MGRTFRSFWIHSWEKNRENWYAHYQAGVGLIATGECERALRVLSDSWRLEKTPWTCHALACAFLALGDKEKCGEWIERGLKMRRMILLT